MRRIAMLGSLLCLAWTASGQADQVLVEAESFAEPGGWVLDTQFINNMGSPYLLAHGLGQPVADATTTVRLASTGEYRVWVRTKDWVARWKAPGQPGRFQVLVDGQPLTETFGTQSADWFWHDGGVVQVKQQEIKLALHDLTGFDGRCDAVFLSNDRNVTPPNGSEILPQWRRELLGLADKPTELSGYDLVVVGGGYSGLGAAISAARMGCKVALIQDRPVLGGNGSSEVRVWANGLIRRGRFPRIGEIVEEFADQAKKSPGQTEEFGDDVKASVVLAEKNIDLFLNHFAYQVEMDAGQIQAVQAFDTRTSEHKRFTGKFFCDATGHGTLGALAGAHYDMTPKGRMGMSNMWRWDEAPEPTTFPATPWALDLTMNDFPYPRDFHGQWFWESGFDKDPLNDAEAIRDWNLRAVFGAFNAMKNGDGAAQHPKAVLSWVAYIGGPRESRRLLGDVILSQDDIVAKRDFPDGCVPSTWSIDLHYPKQQYAEKFPDNPFISRAEFNTAVDRVYGYPVPYRCFYSRNIPNLFMAGRCISVTHEALGTVRVMKTCGMMGEVVGRAASICVQQDCTPREVYEKHLAELNRLLDLPGKARRATVEAPIVIPPDVPRRASSSGPPTGLDPESLPGVVIDDRAAIQQGAWTEGTGLKGYFGYGYLYASAGSGASIRFEFKPPAAGRYEVRLAYQPHENRGTRVPVSVTSPAGTVAQQINMRQPPPLDQGFVSLGQFEFRPDAPAAVEIGTRDAGGNAHADAVQFLPVP